MTTLTEQQQSAVERRFQRENLIQIHRAGIGLLVLWALVSAGYLAVVASRVPTGLVELPYDASQTTEQRAQAIAEWEAAFPLHAFDPVVSKREPYSWPDETPEDQIRGLNAMASRVVVGFRETSHLLWFLHAVALVIAAVGWKRSGVGYGLGILLIGFIGYPEMAENFIGMHNERLFPWILPVFVPGLVCLVTGICSGVFHPDDRQASDWQWFWGGFGLTVLGTAFIASLFMGISGRGSGKGAIALPLGLYFMSKHGWRLIKRRIAGDSLPKTTPSPDDIPIEEASTANMVASVHGQPGQSLTTRVAYATSFFWGLLVALLVGATAFFLSRGMSSEDDGWRVLELMIAPLIATVIGLVVSRRLTRSEKPGLMQAIPVGVFLVGLVVAFVFCK